MGKKTRIGLILLAVLALIEGAGAVATELTNSAPMTAETIKTDLEWPWNLGKSTITDVQRFLEKEKQAHALYNFPNKGTISAGNSIVITNPDVIKDASPLPATPTAKHDIYLLEPVENLDVTNSVEYGMDLAGKGNSSPFPERYQQEAIKNNVKNMLLLKNIPKDSVLLSPIDGVLRYLGSPDPNITDVGAEIIFTASDGTEEEICMAGFDILRLAPLIDSITPFTGNNPPGDIIYLQVKRGQPIAKTLQSGNLLVTSIAQPDKNNSSNIYPTNINLLSIPDPTTGVQKTVIVASQ